MTITIDQQIALMLNAGWRPTATGLKKMEPEKMARWQSLIAAADSAATTPPTAGGAR